MSKTKAGGKTRQHHARAGKRLGIKSYGDQKITTGAIIVRQKGTKIHPDSGVGIGRDHTIFAAKNGTVKFFTRQGRQFVSVV